MKQTEWISVKDRLPEPGYPNRYLCTDGEDLDIMRFHGLDRHDQQPEWSSDACNTYEPTHWMALPGLPE